ncbi:MAG: hypothetical protein K2J78_12430 [Muribaculaceae bacterium]|nr:hypothetical protein [Muribaculaceae bacterium]
MRTIFLIILGLLPIISVAQKPTAAQEQAALNSAKQFCNLLVRFSEGERTLNTQINTLFSGADCSAFDDIKSNKEVTLRNYLMAIQQQYPKKLEMSITTPSLANSTYYVEPTMSMSTEWQNHSTSDVAMTESIVLSTEGISNFYIMFDVVQKYPSLGKSINKKIIYDVKTGKLTAFITNSGSYISYLNGLLAFSKGDYSSAIRYFDLSVQNDRSSLKKACYGFACMAAIYCNNFENAVKYAELYGDTAFITVTKLQYYLQHENFEAAFPYIKELESLLKTRTDFSDKTKSEFYLLLANMYINPLVSYQDIQKALYFISKAEESGSNKSGHFIYVWYLLLPEGTFVSAETAFKKLGESASAGYPPAIYMWGYNLERIEEPDQALRWYEKAINYGNHRAMASAGKMLIEKGEKNKGISYLKKSLEGNALDIELEDMDLTYGFRPIWPQSRNDVETFLKSVSTTTSTHSGGSSNTSSSGLFNPSSSNSTTTTTNHTTSTTSIGNSHNNYSNSSYHNSSSYHNNSSYHSRHHSFNEAKDDFCMSYSLGYVQKKWVYHAPDYTEGTNAFGEDKPMNGIQVGIRVDPQFGYGLGINTGLFYEYYFSKSDEMFDEGLQYHFTAEEHCLYMPIHFKYSLNFSKWFQLALYGGLGLDYGLKGRIYMRCEGETLTSLNMYNNELDMKRFNTSLEYGAAMRINHFQINFTVSKGLINMSDNDDYKVKLDKLFCISIGYCL